MCRAKATYKKESVTCECTHMETGFGQVNISLFVSDICVSGPVRSERTVCTWETQTTGQSGAHLTHNRMKGADPRWRWDNISTRGMGYIVFLMSWINACPAVFQEMFWWQCILAIGCRVVGQSSRLQTRIWGRGTKRDSQCSFASVSTQSNISK